MDYQAPHPMQRYWNFALAAVEADALRTALELGIFPVLRIPRTAGELAQQLALHSQNTAHLLELLWSMGLLERGQGGTGGCERYRLGETARAYLLPDAPGYCGDAWRFRLDSLRGFAQSLGEHVRHGPASRGGAASGSAWARAAEVQIAQEQRAVTAPTALAVMADVPELTSARRFLDLGGGPGIVAVELARAYPSLHGVVFDLPEAAAVARHNIEEAGLDDRLAAVGGDLEQDDIGAGYDVIWCSAVWHFVRDLGATLVKIRRALAPGGVLVSVHAERPETAGEAARVLPYYLPLLMRGCRVMRRGELAAALGDAGFCQVDGFDVQRFPLTPVRVLLARAPRDD